MMETIANMTLDELKKLIIDLMDEQRMDLLLNEHDMEDAPFDLDDEPDNRTLEEVLADIERDRWTPPPGTPSPSQMIREDRDSR